jgi:hypothetical protein
VVLTLGSNPNTSVPIYRKNNYSHIEYFYRYVIPLNTDKYTKLLGLNSYSQYDVENWIANIDFIKGVEPSFVDPHTLEEIWVKFSENLNLFGLYRSSEFWKWRYVENVGYKYLFFYENNVGVIIGRKEKVLANNLEDYHVFRLIEILPNNGQVWNGAKDYKLIKLLKGVLTWALHNDCCSVDFHHSTSRFGHILDDAGFVLQTPEYGPPIASLAGLFQPLVFKPALVNGHWSINKKKFPNIIIDAESTYFVKSDGDRDRTNYWPPID